jgi:hypothetical protein
MKWDCPKHPLGPPLPPRAQVAPVDHSNLDEIAAIVQQLEQLGFTPADISQTQILRATLAHLDMISNCFVASRPSWIVDSGATDHMTGNKSILSGLTTTSQLGLSTKLVARGSLVTPIWLVR